MPSPPLSPSATALDAPPVAARLTDAGSPPAAVGTFYDDPANLSEYPCEKPTTWPFAEQDRDGGGGAHDGRDSGTTPVNGRLPPAVIQHIVRENFPRLRLCYENGMRRNANLMGRITTQFVIDRAGMVSAAQAVCTSLPDPEVVRCVVDGFRGLAFPPPDGGMVTVVYPIEFSPGD
jgi:hypothetical protein